MIKRDYARCGYKPGFGDRLKLSRHNCKCRIDVLAKLIKVSTKTVIAWEKNEAMPDLNQAILAARCLGVSLDFLLRAIPEEYGPKEKALMRAYRESVDKRDEVDDLLGLLHVRRPVYLHHMDTVEDLRAREWTARSLITRALQERTGKRLKRSYLPNTQDFAATMTRTMRTSRSFSRRSRNPKNPTTPTKRLRMIRVITIIR